MQQFYVFDPATNKFLSWDGKWTSFTGAKDFLSITEAKDASRNRGTVHVFELRS